MKKAQEPRMGGSWTKNGLAFSTLYFHLSDNCDTLEWTVVVAILNDNVTHETSGTLFVLSNPLLHCCAK